MLEETNSAGTVLARYTTAGGSYYAPLLHMWRASGSVSRMPMYDLTGSVRGLLDGSGNVTDTYTLEAFGAARGSTGTTVNPYRFGGAWGYINGGSGLQQLGARFYWPELGRFVQQDPVGEGMNWYGYAYGNPVLYTDPEGEVVDTVVDAGFAAWDVATAIRCPSWQNIGYAAVSVTALAVPFVPNVVGYARHGAQLAEAARRASRYEKAAAAAGRRYPKLAEKIHAHHMDPKYIGGPRGGRTEPIDAALHQVIHNEIYKRFPKGTGPVASAGKQAYLDRIHRKFGL